MLRNSSQLLGCFKAILTVYFFVYVEHIIHMCDLHVPQVCKDAIEATQQRARMPLRAQGQLLKVVRLDGWMLLKRFGFMPSKKSGLKQSKDKQGRAWTILIWSAFICGFQNGLARFKAVGQL